MYRPSGTGRSPGVAAIGLVLFLAACGTQGSSPEGSAAGGPSEALPSESAPVGEPVEIEWFVGLGTGENEEQIPTEEAVVEAFNAANPDIHLELTVVDNTEASTTLAT